MNAININAPLILVMLILLVLSFRLSMSLARRAICKVISIFRQNNAVQYERALPLDSMGLRATNQLFAFRLLRDYKPWAIQTLMQAGVIRAAATNTFYLSEDTLRQYPGVSCPVKLK
jgi:hypothetical protein